MKKEFLSYKMKHKVSVIKGKKEKVNYELNYNLSEYYLIKRNEVKDLRISISMNEEVCAPVKEKEILGNLKVTLMEKEIMNINVVAKENVEKKGILDYAKEITKFILNK